MYDVFISFKNLGEDGLPTRDSVLAKEIYDKLSRLGFNVFFSLVTLEKLGVSAYKYAIDKALDSASILVAVGTSRENLDSQWVRYEWDSFFNDIISGIKPEGKLFTCIEGCVIKSLPRVLRQSQVFDRNNGGIDKLVNFISNSISIEHKEGVKGDEIDSKISMTSTKERKIELIEMPRIEQENPIKAQTKVEVALESHHQQGKEEIIRIEIIARAIYSDYNERLALINPNEKMVSFDELSQERLESYRRQAHSILKELSRIGCVLRPIGSVGKQIKSFPLLTVEVLAEIEHEDWTREKIMNGWTYGPVRDELHKHNQYMVDYNSLDETIKEYDRATVRNLPNIVNACGFAIYKDTDV